MDAAAMDTSAGPTDAVGRKGSEAPAAFSAPRRGRLAHRRAGVLALVLATVATFLWVLSAVLFADGLDASGLVMLGAMAVPLAIIALSFWSALIGFAIALTRKDPARAVMPLATGPADAPLSGRTAVLMPVYHEDPDRVLAGIAAMRRALDATGQAGAFDWFLLSDTRDGADARAEEATVAAWRTDHPAWADLTYRRRTDNAGRKAGNIAEFCARWGEGYDYLLVLDADSLMDGPTMVRLARLMDRNPRAGLIQTTPLVTRQTTLFGRLLQFGTRVASHPLALGMAYWQGSEGNYYGHNAILRARPFIDHCRLPTVRRLGHLSGEILSHDFVEAASMRRAGYEVWSLPVSDGSFEEMPPDLPRYLKRDRRWCTGNLQHLAVLAQPRLHWVSRLHLSIGILSYLAAPLWMVLLLAGCWSLFHEPTYYFPITEPSLFWPIADQPIAIGLFVFAVIMLLTPKLTGAALIIGRPALRRAHGGTLRFAVSLWLEILFTALLAPAMMVAQTAGLVGILAGRLAGWEPQNRTGQALRWRDALRSQGLALLLGLALAGYLAWAAPAALGWFAPVIAGLLLVVPFAVLGAREDWGQASRALGLFRVPEEAAGKASETGGHITALDLAPEDLPAAPRRAA
jgi:membrane glycosyltransferase